MWERYEYEDGWDWKCPKCANLQTFRTKRCQKCGEIIGEGIEERGIQHGHGDNDSACDESDNGVI